MPANGRWDLIRRLKVNLVELLLSLRKKKQLTFYNLLVTWCKNQFIIQQLYALPTLYLSVLYLSNNKECSYVFHNNYKAGSV